MSWKIFVCGDLHASDLFFDDAYKLDPEIWEESKNLTKKDVLIVLGDFWYLWYPLWTNKEQEKKLDILASLPYTIAVVPWNHENYREIFKLPIENKRNNEVFVLKRKKWNIYFLKRWQIYNINNRKILAIGGAYSIDKWLRLEWKSRWPEELLDEEEKKETIKNIEKFKKIDYILSHTWPKSIIMEFLWIQYDPKLEDPVANFLEEIYKYSDLDFKQRHFWHLHLDDYYKDKNWKEFFCHYNSLPYELK